MPEPKTRPAHIADIITAYTGFTCTVDGTLAGVQRMVEFMVNRKLLPFQLPRGVDTVKPTLAELFPWLDVLTPPDTEGCGREEARDKAYAWMEEIASEHGLVHRVPRLPEGTWEPVDPIIELRSLMGQDAEVMVVVDTGDSWVSVPDPAPGMFRNPPLDDDESEGD